MEEGNQPAHWLWDSTKIASSSFYSLFCYCCLQVRPLPSGSPGEGGGITVGPLPKKHPRASACHIYVKMNLKLGSFVRHLESRSWALGLNGRRDGFATEFIHPKAGKGKRAGAKNGIKITLKQNPTWSQGRPDLFAFRFIFFFQRLEGNSRGLYVMRSCLSPSLPFQLHKGIDMQRKEFSR